MIRKAINDVIKSHHININKLAAEAGYSTASLHRYLIGQVDYDYQHFTRLMSLLGLSVGFKRVGVATHSIENLRPYLSTMLDERKIKTHDLAVLTGVNYCTLSSYFNGKRMITASNLELVLKALGLEILQLA